jgi:hypothetical protein
VDDKYCEEGQADLFCHLLRDSRCHNAHIKLKSPPCVGERLITPEINKRKIQEKQGKDELERGADRDVRTV